MGFKQILFLRIVKKVKKMTKMTEMTHFEVKKRILKIIKK